LQTIYFLAIGHVQLNIVNNQYGYQGLYQNTK